LAECSLESLLLIGVYDEFARCLADNAFDDECITCFDSSVTLGLGSTALVGTSMSSEASEQCVHLVALVLATSGYVCGSEK
jgi:hypothetical protein